MDSLGLRLQQWLIVYCMLGGIWNCEGFIDPILSSRRNPTSSRHSHQRWIVTTDNDDPTNHDLTLGRRAFFATAMVQGIVWPVFAETSLEEASLSVDVVPPSPDARKLFNEARAYESQGNLITAQKLYDKVTRIAPNFIYGWSNLGNTQTAFGDLTSAEQSYTKAIDLCATNLEQTPEGMLGPKRCSEYYLLLLNRGSLRINNGRPKEGLADLQQSAILRARPDAVVLQNLARAEEMNGFYKEADRDYSTAIQMTANEVVPFWLRSVLVKYQLGDVRAGFDLLKRVENRFPQAPEVRAAYAVFLWSTGDTVAARQKFLEVPDRARLKYVDNDYLKNTVNWPPAMLSTLREITKAVGDS